ncbi:protein brambleberry-like [Contarinia nasturtii]|uniref:protein brambleberry-like n=1 Tax=Contarinia nasturtii TaxID=265458 RepID=UPI0012D39348|nr:protein brambleberry-like [Contarinia nasturtii]
MFVHRWLMFIVLSSSTIHIVQCSFFDYFIPRRSNFLSGTEVDSPVVPYEIATSDEKFLQEASKLIGVNLSELDLCHHRVVLKLRNSCHELNAEQVGKLAVMLLNCQSNSEGRPLFECTENMSLKDCTSGMDSDTWNAYHLITNRAKAVCVATRHEQFRGLTEITVNKLMSSAQHQIIMLKKLSENQNELHELTSQAMDDFTKKNEKVIDQQKEILQVSNSHRAIVEGNLHELMREKGLIRSGQVEVARLIETLKGKLDESLANLKVQSRQMKDNQAALLEDLNNLQTNAFHISDKLSDTSEYILSQNEIASTQFDQTIQRLSEINHTIEKLQKLMTTLESSVDDKLTWITSKLGGADEALKNIYLILQYIGYLLFGMLILVFINAPGFYRIFFIFAVPLNFACTLCEWHYVSLIELTQILVTVFACNLIRQMLWNMKSPFALNKKTGSQHTKEIPQNQPETEREASQEKQYNEFDGNDNNNDYSYNHLSAFKNRHREYMREQSMTPSVASNQSFDARGLTPFTSTLMDRTRCISLTVKGDQCRNAAVTNQIYCRRHEK